jgi:hypothetical protein
MADTVCTRNLRLHSGKSGANDTVATGDNTNSHTTFLFSIAESFGISNEQASELVRQVFVEHPHIPAMQHDSCETYQAALSKHMIRKCLFHIGSRICEHPQRVTYTPAGPYNISYSTFHRLPLTYHAVYVLYEKIGFNEPEIADVLNIAPAEVRTRLAKAYSLNSSVFYK